MKTRLILATLLLLAFGTLKAQDTLNRAPQKMDTTEIVCPDEAEFSELMRELGVNLQQLSDSVDWEKFERDMEKWGESMERWGRKMEKWGDRFERRFDRNYDSEYQKWGEPEVKAIRVEGSGDVLICQNRDLFSVVSEERDPSHYRMEGERLILSGSDDFTVTLQNLEELGLHSSGDVTSKGTLKGRNLFIEVTGSGDISLYVDYDTICVNMRSSGDVTLNGQCNVLFADVTGSGDLMVRQLMVMESRINATGSGMAITPGSGSVIAKRHSEKVQKRNSLLYDAHWNGFEAGLNMLFDAPQEMELRPLRSWYFGFNIADVGIAFDRRHTVGLFTGIGLGWNNFSWNNPVTVEYNPDHEEYVVEPIESDKVVKNTKHGVLFLQAPLMFEVRPTRHMYIDAGVTGGLRIAQWNRVKFEDGTQDKHYYGSSINRFKLDASLRVGGNDVGFFANYALLPLFTTGDTEVHPVSFGFSINF